MDIRYAYPNHHIFRRIRKLDYYNASFELDKLEYVTDLFSRLVSTFGDRVFTDLPRPRPK